MPNQAANTIGWMLTVEPSGTGPNTAHGRELEEQRLAEEEDAALGRLRHHVRQGHAEEQRGDEHDETGDRAGDADVEQHLAGRESLADPDDRAQRAGQEQSGGIGMK